MTSRHELVEESLKLGLAKLSKDGALLVDTGKFTGRAAKQRFFSRRKEVEDTINWGNDNQPVEPAVVEQVEKAVLKKFSEVKTYNYQGYAGGVEVEVTSTSPWHIIFAGNMFREESVQSLLPVFEGKRIKIHHDPYGKLSDYNIDFKFNEAIFVDPLELKVFIVGTAYAGEIKKSAFTLCNYLLPKFDILPMHSSANCSEDGKESTVLFGLSGTGKTTLSADPEKYLIGDDEIVWSPEGLTNLEGGCYAKLINLDKNDEPVIYAAANRYGSILENVVYDDESREVDFFNGEKAENTRASYSLESMDKVFDQNKEAQAPKNIIFLTADAFCALPAVAKLNSDQAQYHFISGYTAKVAGTELGVQEPTATFSACFGAPFMPRHPSVYGKLLANYAKKYNANVWLLNTGWFGGPYGVGKRFPIKVTRTILHAIQNGILEKQEFTKHPVFGFEVPKTCPEVEEKYLKSPEGEQVNKLAKLFIENMKTMSAQMDPKVISHGGPLLEKSNCAQV